MSSGFDISSAYAIHTLISRSSLWKRVAFCSARVQRSMMATALDEFDGNSSRTHARYLHHVASGSSTPSSASGLTAASYSASFSSRAVASDRVPATGPVARRVVGKGAGFRWPVVRWWPARPRRQAQARGRVQRHGQTVPGASLTSKHALDASRVAPALERLDVLLGQLPRELILVALARGRGGAGRRSAAGGGSRRDRDVVLAHR